MLAAHFLTEFCEAYGKKPKEFSGVGDGSAAGYPWPGNVRELKNLVERLVIMCPSPTHRAAPFAARAFSRRVEKPAEALRKLAGGALGLRTRIRAAQAGRESLEHDQGRRGAGPRAQPPLSQDALARNRAVEGFVAAFVNVRLLIARLFLDLLRGAELFELAVPIELADEHRSSAASSAEP